MEAQTLGSLQARKLEGGEIEGEKVRRLDLVESLNSQIVKMMENEQIEDQYVGNWKTK